MVQIRPQDEKSRRSMIPRLSLLSVIFHLETRQPMIPDVTEKPIRIIGRRQHNMIRRTNFAVKRNTGIDDNISMIRFGHQKSPGAT